MQVLGSTPGDCGSMAAPMKLSGNSSLTRKHSSLQIAAQVELVSKSPTWCAMKLARGLNTVRSEPRSFMSLSWLVSIDSRSSSSLIFRLLGSGCWLGSFSAAICRSRQAPSAAGAVV